MDENELLTRLMSRLAYPCTDGTFVHAWGPTQLGGSGRYTTVRFQTCKTCQFERLITTG